MATNRKDLNEQFTSRNLFLKKGIKCVFISYQNNDKSQAKKIADYLINAGIDVYFDEYDDDLKLSNQSNHPGQVTNALTKGINNSSHMLVIVSPTTMRSNWVPFEIGYGYDKTDLAVLTLKGIPKNTIPDYIKTAKIIRDIWDLNSLTSKIKEVDQEVLIHENSIKSYNNPNHPLNSYMDKYTT
ncbi:toll/interleukin-1 receptor domain-containing protein [Aquimarina litoralis]|uniref:toll/interleukin-1 receptor domain-containing protein n=1 Tax=Aquimarina litoralis TaxID=584605 RepID=UPI001C55C615|nr:toll/interleukin-1 receptor domain-containing protein [Aquimarina litoralis]MBW1298124.1 TIR domain-containing protein [Aquimarina litoralis]